MLLSMLVAVVTVDQVGSRGAADLVDPTLATLTEIPALRGFERTAGDEFQGVLDDPAALARVVEPLLRTDAWSVGIGIGEVDEPLPATARAGRGAAYQHARGAVDAAKGTPWRVCVRASDAEAAGALEAALWLWAALLSRRTPRGWEVADLLEGGASHAEAARSLGVSPPAISQRARAAGIVEGRRARELATYLTGLLLNGSDG
jgi:hypothetical protein